MTVLKICIRKLIIMEILLRNIEIGGFEKNRFIFPSSRVSATTTEEGVMVSELVQGVVRGRLWGSKLLNVLR